MRNRLNEGAIIWGGEIEETDPYATRKRLMDEFLKRTIVPEKVEEKPKEEAPKNLKRLIDQLKEKSGR